MKKFLLISLSLLVSNLIFAQKYGNEWINFNQNYYKIKIGKEGIYRIDSASLQSIGFPLSSVDPKNIQLWINGEEQPILVNGENDGSFNSGDYIEFYGTYNDGKLDSSLYRNPDEQPHQYMSLYSDTATYFLTYTASTQGKRIQVNNDKDYTGKTADPYFLYEQVIWYNNKNGGQSFDGLGFSAAGFYSEYTEGEGWALQFSGGGTKFTFLTPYLSNLGPSPLLQVLAHSRANNTSSYDANGFNNGIQITFDASGKLIEEKRVTGYNKYYFEDSLAKSDIGSAFTRFKIASSILAKSIHSISYSKLTYPRLFNLNDSSNFHFDYTSKNNFIHFSKYPSGKSKPIVYDVNSFSKSNGEIIGTELYCNLANSDNQKKLYILDETSIISVSPSNLKPYKFNELNLALPYDYLIISNHLLDSGAKAYKDFLMTTNGGNHATYLAFTDDIYDQFYFGVKHPKALQNFCRFAINSSSTLKFLLLLGKGQIYSNVRYNNILSNYWDLIPTCGNPATDYFFTSGFNGSVLEPLLATGRIPAKSNNEIRNYLKKISTNNQNGYEVWKKRILQLGGGATNTDVTWFSAILDNYYNIIRQPLWGASRLKYLKNDPSAIDTSLTDKIQNAINDGYSLIDYFGHGSADATDISLGNPLKLKNINKYPVFYLNGCALGNTFNMNSLAEDYLFGIDKGAIGWIAGTAFGDVSSLDAYSKILHSNLTSFPSKSVAENISKTIKSFQLPNYPSNRSQCRQMCYFGDPSYLIFNADNPDYTVNQNSFSILPKEVTADVDSFIISFSIDNLALATLDSFNINIFQKYPDNFEKLILKKKLQNIPSEKVLEFWIKNDKANNLAGLNYFTILIDSSNSIEEQFPNGENNNQKTFNYFFPSNRALALLPPSNSILNNIKVTLSAQLLSNNNSKKIIFELDTSNQFNSPKKQTEIVNNSSSLKQANFYLMPIDSIDYFWRVKVEDENTNNSWDVSTFTFIYDSPNGWSQGYWQKFVNSKQENIKLSNDKSATFLTHQSNKYDLYSGKNNPNANPSIWQSYHPLFFGYFTNGITVTAVSSKNENRLLTGSNYNLKSSSNPWWNVAKDRFYYKYYEPRGIVKSGGYGFNTNLKADRDSLVNFLNKIPDDYYLMVTFGYTTGIKSWEDTLFKTFEQFGAISIRNVGEGEPYTLVSKRNAPPSSVSEKIVDYSSTIPPTQQNLSFTAYLSILSSKGGLTSNPIGPAVKWKNMYSQLLKADSDCDKVAFEVYGIKKSGNDTLLIKDIKTTSANLDKIDAIKFPFIKIKALIKDSTIKTPQLIKRWTVLFDGFPEGMINSDLSNFINKDTLDEGDSLHFKIAFQNISILNMDSILVAVNEINSNNVTTNYYTKKFKPLVISDYLIIDEKISTKNKSKTNGIQVIFNPNNAQPELYSFNNSYQFNYFVINDTKNPLLDVVFDGRHITNMEIVSPNPSITITSSDENKFYYLDDPSYFKVKLKEPGSATYRELDVTSDTFNFVAAKGPNDKSKLIFNPLNLKDGIYELAVTVRDAKGNFASDEDYKISFQIITKSTITNVYPYPNPFTTKTKFIFTLTGEKVPEYFKIAVISVSGTVVKEITLDDLGPINIGNNITKYEWDGTDTYGDKLANGVYLYKVTAKLNGKDIELIETAGDSFFKKGFGKLYIMR